MIKRSFDLPLLLRNIQGTVFEDKAEDFKKWFNMPNNLMFTKGDNVGLATYEYPGVYTLHWFFQARGREAIDLGKAMVANLFENYGMETARGLIRKDLAASRWAVRKVGLKSHGFLTDANGREIELFAITKQEFLDNLKKETK